MGIDGQGKLPPLEKFEMNRMAHARAQELHLPGSPKGKSGHDQLSWAARANFQVDSWSKLEPEQMKQVYEFMENHGRMPGVGELRRG